MTNSLTYLFKRDLDRLSKEINTFQEESNIWKTQGDIKNSAGSLCLHITGNLRHFIGAILGKSGYVRDREFEFSGQPISNNQLQEEIEKARLSILSTVGSLSNDELAAPFPIDVLGDGSNTKQFIIHLYGHLNYHLGQINYLRRILEK